MTVPLRAALYLRVSTARQAEHDVSIPDQKRQGEAYCQSRGYPLVEMDDPALKDRIAGLKATRDQAQADAERAQVLLESSGQQAVTPQMVRKFARTARERMRIDGGDYPAVTISERSPSASRLRIRKSVSWDRRVIC
ncbi:MAG: recombinase family protein [Rhodanobacter sp.]